MSQTKLSGAFECPRDWEHPRDRYREVGRQMTPACHGGDFRIFDGREVDEKGLLAITFPPTRDEKEKRGAEGERKLYILLGDFSCDFSLIRSRGKKSLSRVIPFYSCFRNCSYFRNWCPSVTPLEKSTEIPGVRTRFEHGLLGRSNLYGETLLLSAKSQSRR